MEKSAIHHSPLTIHDHVTFSLLPTITPQNPLFLFKLKIAMRKTFFLLFVLVISVSLVRAQQVQRPKLVVGIVIDQMRWDYLYRYYDVFKPTGGFRRMLNQGFSCENTFIPFVPTVTAAGHTCVYTGSVPAIHGIVSNYWWDNIKNKSVYCTEDTVQTVGSNSAAGRQSPRNMFTTTIGDELRLATNFKSKVIGVAMKDRGSILPAGHSATAAYWYDYGTGNFITSTYYMQQLPAWVSSFNQRKVVDSLYQFNWDLYLPKSVYPKYCTEDVKAYEVRSLGADQPGFPYDLTRFTGKDYGKIGYTPYGNTLTEMMAEAAVKAENLGKNTVTDMLAVSFSSTDYIGHSFGPNSWEQLDDYARLDATLGRFFDFLDATVGKGNYTAFLTADHAVAHSPKFSIENKLPGGPFEDTAIFNRMNAVLQQKYGKAGIIRGDYSFQLVFNDSLINAAQLNKQEIIEWSVNYLKLQKEIAQVFPISELQQTPLTSRQREMINNGYFPARSGAIQFILKPGYVEGHGNGTSHGSWNPYDSHIPLLWYGWGIKQGRTTRETYMTDISATLAGMLRIQMPSGCVGHVIGEVLK
jgi:predicted AlkP superfamily pyrophosphatase or phosphodiesterase